MPDTTDHFRIAYALPDDYVNAYPGATAQRAATTIDSILYSLYNKITALETIEKLPSGDHSLDDYTETGQHLYHQMLNGNATAERNYPAQLAGVLISITLEQFSYQIYWTLSSNNTIYYRTRYSTTWHPWKQVSTAAELADLAGQVDLIETAMTTLSNRVSGVESDINRSTGLRDITAQISSHLEQGQTGKLYLSRVGPAVTLTFDMLSFAVAGWATLTYIPSGFRPMTQQPTPVFWSSSESSFNDTSMSIVRSSGALSFSKLTSGLGRSTVTFVTNDPWPSTLPGNPA